MSDEYKHPLHNSNHMRGTFTSAKPLDDLHRVYFECRFPNWDGHQALPVADEISQIAERFLNALPLDFPCQPSIGAEPDGQLTLEWHHGPRRTLSVSVSSTSELHYAVLIGSDSFHGTEKFFDEIPLPIFELIFRVCTK